MHEHSESDGCGCCDRREFLAAGSLAAGGLTLTALSAAASAGSGTPRVREGATIRAVFLYPPSGTFADKPDGWWSWPGNDFDAEGRQKQAAAALAEMEKKLGVKILVEPRPVAGAADAERIAKELQDQAPDGLLLMMYYNRSLKQAEVLMKAAAEKEIPVVFFIGLGVMHGPVAPYRRPGVYFIQSLDNYEAIEYGLRMIQAKKRMGQSTILCINEAPRPTESVESLLGTRIRVIPFPRYADLFHGVVIDDEARAFIAKYTQEATEIRGVTPEAMENAARAHLALKKLMAQEDADGVTMNCLRRGMLKPCISFVELNNALIPAACENDVPAALTQLLGQLLLGRSGFQHNPAFETERNHYYASHCTCPTRPYGPEGPQLPYLLRHFAHSNEGSCAIQVFWTPGDPVTMARYYPGKEPMLDVYSGKVFKSHPMPPAGGCCTNVEIEITDREDACTVKGHHNLIFCGDWARHFRLFAQMFRVRLGSSVYTGAEPV